MTTNELMMEAAKLRLRFRMNNRLRLESMAVLSRLFREHQEPIADELLSLLVFAVPEELVGEAEDTSRSAILGKSKSKNKVPPDRIVRKPPPSKVPPIRPPKKG